jgi:hypothetical protein
MALHEIGRVPFRQQEGDFFRRIGMVKNSDMVEEIQKLKFKLKI